MNCLKNIIQRCHKRHEKPLRQKKTLVSPAIYKGVFYHFTVFCERRNLVRLHDLEQAEISFMPIGRAPEHDRVPQSFGKERFLTRQMRTDWNIRLWHTSWGIHIYTGIPSQSGNARWHDLDFSYQAICAAPDTVLACVEMLCNAVVNPLLVITKSGGLRFSCRVPDYLHPNSVASRLYIYKDIPTSEDQYQRDVYLEVLGESGHSTWDARYEIVVGDLLDPPIISKEILFTAIDALREELHTPNPLTTDDLMPYSQPVIVSPPSFGSQKLDLAKEAFLKRGFTYSRQENDYHYWTTQQVDEDLLLWEQDGTVWIRAVSPNTDIPSADTRITDVWDDTGILPPIPETGLQVSEKIQAIRESKLSPLAIKRPPVVLEKTEGTKKVYETLDKNIEQIQRVFDSDARIIGLTSETQAWCNFEIEKHIIKYGPVGFSASYLAIRDMTQNFQKYNFSSYVRWRQVDHLWDKVKDIPVDVRMATPFQHGNVCEDPERFLALKNKGVNATEILCPQCPVYTVCIDQGYLSQPAKLQRAKTQLFGFEHTYLKPNQFEISEKTLEPFNGTERLCIVDEVNISNLFLGFSVPKDRLEKWCADWNGLALGNFAQALLNAIGIKHEPDDLMVNRIRTVMQAFQLHEKDIVRQMGAVIIKGKVIERGIIDEQNGLELARFTIEFQDGGTAYTPIDNNAADRLKAMQLPFLQFDTFSVETEMNISMPIEQAIRLGIFDITTVEQIQSLPRVYQNPDWTLWHQLQRFFTHYKRDTDAPITLNQSHLQFWVPPVLNPNVNRLLLMSTTLSEKYFQRAFPDEVIEVIRGNTTPWIEGNMVFQIRSGAHSLKTLIDYDSTWDVIGLSKMGVRFLLGICAEIDRDPSVKHAIITYQPIIQQLRDVAEKENVCLITEFKRQRYLVTEFEAADVVWIVGTPYSDPASFWWRAQILHGNDEDPLCYESDSDFQHYKDKRIQKIYMQIVTDFITQIFGRAGLNRLPNKKVVLISSLEIPDITDRPQTLIFDWEDFEIAGSLDKLAETIKIRQQYETDRENITAETTRIEIERILGCSPRTANNLLQKLRGGNIPRITYREQILRLLADGEKKGAEVIAAIEGNPMGIYNELARLTEIGEIIKVRWGVYGLPDSPEK